MADKKLKVLQIGHVNWADTFAIPEGMDWQHAKIEDFSQKLVDHKGKKVKPFEFILFTDADIKDLNLSRLFPFCSPYTVYFNQDNCEVVNEIPFFVSKNAKSLDLSKPEETILFIKKHFFPGQTGSSADMRFIDVYDNFNGEVEYLGNSYLSLDIPNTPDFSPLLTWRYNFICEKDQPLDFWLEYLKESDLRIQLKIYSFKAGTSDVVAVRTFNESDLQKEIHINDGEQTTYLSAVLLVQGQGNLKVGPLHQRVSRSGMGEFIPGGVRLVDQNRQELIAFYSPGDLKPPLNVYFSGYRSAEGFEGFWMMSNMNAPFVLIGDPRLEGGSFYMGTPELENQVVDFIKDKLEKLGFSNDQLVLSGLSMGTFGASFYATKLKPKAVIIGKPLFSLGNIAKNGFRIRPDEFSTAFDMVHLLEKGLNEDAVLSANNRFWKLFDAADLKDTLFAISYMKNDDYDSTAYYDLLDHLSHKNVRVISKGIEGRHNDNSGSINQWFLNQYMRILKLYFEREK